MENRYSIEFTFRTEHTEPSGRASVWGLMCAIQLIADLHARHLGCSREQLLPRGLCWVIARIRLDMDAYPFFDDTIKVTTWPGAPNRLIYSRYFCFEDSDGRILGRATALYLLVDNRTHAPVLSSKIEIYPPGFEMWPQENPMPEKLRLGDALETAAFRVPAYSDIDCNRHMNNTRYVQWVCDLFPTSRFENAALKKFQINYLADGIEGHRIALSLGEDAGAGCFSVRGTDEQAERVVFEAAGEWMTDPK